MKTKKNKFPLNVYSIGKCRGTKKTSLHKSCLPSDILKKISIEKKKKCEPGADHCLLDNTNDILSETQRKQLRTQLRPRYPAEWKNDPDAWLDNFQIESVMRQFEKDNPHFKFYGVYPMDFSAPNPYRLSSDAKCLHEEMCNIQLKHEYEIGFRGLGFIFNLDPHYKSGSHWVAMYINLNSVITPEIYYFDSYGMRVPKLIARLMKSFKFQNKKTRLMWNSRRFQFSDTECGMYSMYFLIAMIRGISFKKFCHISVPDSEMYTLRHILFSQ